jgi:hypothetical protein
MAVSNRDGKFNAVDGLGGIRDDWMSPFGLPIRVHITLKLQIDYQPVLFRYFAKKQ